MSDAEPIRFTAQVGKLQTLVDGGWRLTLDLLPPTGDDAIMDLSKCKRPGIILECAALPVDVDDLKVQEEREQEYGL